MKILAIEKEITGINNENYQPHLKAEALKAWELYQNGIFREMYFTSLKQDQNYAVLILECPGIDEARNILNTLPLVKEGLIDFDLFPLTPYTGFKRLFENQKQKGSGID